MKKFANYIILIFLITLALTSAWKTFGSTAEKLSTNVTPIPSAGIIPSLSSPVILSPQAKNLGRQTAPQTTNYQLPTTTPIPPSSVTLRPSSPVILSPQAKNLGRQTAPQTTNYQLPTTTPGPQTKNLSIKQSVTLKITNQKTETFNIEINSSATVLEVLRQAQAKNYLTMQTKKYSYGEFIESINGQKNSGNYYWFLYINNKRSSLGASQQTVYTNDQNDQIEWKYER